MKGLNTILNHQAAIRAWQALSMAWFENMARPVGISSRTLSNLRWFVVIVQFILVFVIGVVLGFPIALKESMALITILALINISFSLSTVRLGRLNEGKALPMLCLDLIQIILLIAFNGGLENPLIFFCLLPIVIAANMLSYISTMIMGGLMMVMVSIIGFYYAPLPWLPSLFGFFLGAPSLELPWGYRLMVWLSLGLCLFFIIGFIWICSKDSRRLSSALAEATHALAHERELSALGALAAAAAHELGSPLATISVVAKDLKAQDITNEQSWPLIKEDHALLYEQAERCRNILVTLAEKPPKEGGQPYDLPTLSDLIEEIAYKHVSPNIDCEVYLESDIRGMEPIIERKPEFLNALGNLLSNAGQFAQSKVMVKIFWDWNIVRVIIADDGPGFPAQVLNMAGEPYISTRSGKEGHMGLGLFIAITLLESIGASIKFHNQHGAQIHIKWIRDEIEHQAT